MTAPLHEHVSTNTSFHFVREITAHTYATNGAPLTLRLTGLKGVSAEVNIFTYDQALTDRLAAAINGATAAATPPKPDDYRE